MRRDSHNHAASLLELLQQTRQQSVDNLIELVLLLCLRLLVVLSMLLRVMLLLLLLLRLIRIWIRRMMRRHLRRSTGEVYVDAPGVLLRGVLEAEFLTDLFDAGFYFLDVVDGVVSFADDSGRRRGG